MQNLTIFLWLLQVTVGFTWPWEDDTRNPYQPYTTSCPSESLIREAKGISDDESKYLKNRYVHTNSNLTEFLNNLKLQDFDVDDFMSKTSSHNISIGLAFSGGGYRAMFVGAGELLALDNRYDLAKTHGLGGILQSSTYISGLSGGSWLVGSLALNNFASVAEIVDGDLDIWNVENSIFNPNGIDIVKTGKYYTGIGEDIDAKNDVGFNTSLTDIWGRMLANQFFNVDNGGENITWSSIRDTETFKNYEMPYPMILANGRYINTEIVNLNSTVFEISPYELGSWDPSISSFVDVKYLGTSLNNGKPNASDSCVINYDNSGFLMGTSSTLFNKFISSIKDNGISTYLVNIVNGLLKDVNDNTDVDVAIYDPNPFYNVEFGTSDNLKTNEQLHLVDGSEDAQNIPLYPMIQPHRDVDVIFAFDNSADTEQQWPNGSAIINTFERQFVAQGKGSPIPHVPETVEDFLDYGFNKRPIFFGCYANKLQDLVDEADNGMNTTDIPLIIYIPNQEVSYASNISTFELEFEDTERDSLITNGFEIASSDNLTMDKYWNKCVGCAIIRRNQERFGMEQSDECKKCFDKYCWYSSGNSSSGSTSDSGSSSTSGSGSSSTSGSSSSSISASSSSSSTKSSGGIKTSVTSSGSQTSTSSGSSSTQSGGSSKLVPSLLLALLNLI